jgi:hypothetical protein
LLRRLSFIIAALALLAIGAMLLSEIAYNAIGHDEQSQQRHRPPPNH